MNIYELPGHDEWLEPDEPPTATDDYVDDYEMFSHDDR